MSNAEAQAKAKAIDELLVPIRAKLDQLEMTVEAEGVDVTRQTTELLLAELTSLHTLEEEARKTNNQRLISRVTKERDRARVGLGFIPRKRRRS